MNKLTTLKFIIDIVWILASSIAIFFIVFTISGLFASETVLALDNGIFNINSSEKPSFVKKTLFVISLFTYVFELLALYRFKQVLTEFYRNRIFTLKVVQYFNHIGQLLFASAIVRMIVFFVYNLVEENQLRVDLSFDRAFIFICLGLFFMGLSELFKRSKSHKEENDLTI